jgi:hypothetical protein
MHRSRYSIALATGLTCTLIANACADVHIDGTPAAARVTTSQDSIADVLAALSAAFKIRYRSAVRLDEPAAASYTGSFGQVVARLLDGYTYIVKHEGDIAEVIVFGKRGDTPIVAPSAKPSTSKDITSRWR